MPALNCTVTSWPNAFDTKNDIFEIGKMATFKRELNAALSTRGMLRYIQEQPLTKQPLTNPIATQDQIDDTFATAQQARHDKLTLAAANLPSLIKLDTLNQMEQQEINALAAENDAVRLYELIMVYLDLRGGRAQDRVQKRFGDMTVKSSDSAATIGKQIDLKWYLFKNHALYEATTQQREGMRGLQVNIAPEVPMPVMAEGQLIEELNATCTHGPSPESAVAR
jgi:hypothetical protein